MKLPSCITLTAMLFSFAACEQKPKPLGEKINDKVDDALDRRRGEKVRDAAEDVAKDTKDAVKQ